MRLAHWFWLTAAVACSNDSTHHLADAPALPDACVGSGSAQVTVSGPASYVCHADFMAQIALTNPSCTPTTVTGIKLHADVTSGSCAPPADFTYQPSVATVPALGSAEVLDLKSGPFCCTAPACPATFDCTEHYTYEVETSAGTLTGSADVSLDLDGCDVVCS